MGIFSLSSKLLIYLFFEPTSAKDPNALFIAGHRRVQTFRKAFLFVKERPKVDTILTYGDDGLISTKGYLIGPSSVLVEPLRLVRWTYRKLNLVDLGHSILWLCFKVTSLSLSYSFLYLEDIQ